MLSKLVSQWQGKRIGVIGDVMLDVYISGDVKRISPEAPVPVVHVVETRYVLGGAGNVARNIITLGGEVILCGVIGEDTAGKTVTALLTEAGLTHDYLISDTSRPTIEKVRVCADTQQLIRYDIEDVRGINADVSALLVEKIEACILSCDALVVSDYAKGVVTADLMKIIATRARERGIPLLVDPKPAHASWYEGATLLTPNHHEARAMAGTLGVGDGIEDIAQLGVYLTDRLQSALLITRGGQGMSLFESASDARHFPTFADRVVDVVGAGDSVVAAAALALSVGASSEEAALLSNYAAAITVGKQGTATVSHHELNERLTHTP